MITDLPGSSARSRNRPGAAALLATAVGSGVALQVGPAATWLPGVRRFFPALAGVGDPGHLALTFDDGPDPASTPRVLEALRDAGVHATFFVVGERAATHPHLLRRLVDDGHEIGLHAWRHRYALWASPHLARCTALLQRSVGVQPRWFRAPYGVVSGAAFVEARRLALTPILWTAWGRDWVPGTPSDDVMATFGAGLRGGATLLLHDVAWHRDGVPDPKPPALQALPAILERCRELGLRTGPLRDHGVGTAGARLA